MFNFQDKNKACLHKSSPWVRGIMVLDVVCEFYD